MPADLTQLRVAPVTQPKKQIHVGYVSPAANEFTSSVDMTRAVLISVVAFVEPGKYVPITIEGKVYRIAVTEHEAPDKNTSRIISPSAAD